MIFLLCYSFINLGFDQRETRGLAFYLMFEHFSILIHYEF
uniref:Uncharacterized protein n=1 Tax=Rhizophora mucronata TaxID=61149 RepID=A0A2P2NGZ1_RHIMU